MLCFDGFLEFSTDSREIAQPFYAGNGEDTALGLEEKKNEQLKNTLCACAISHGNNSS
jgi:hypothetical protein